MRTGVTSTADTDRKTASAKAQERAADMAGEPDGSGSYANMATEHLADILTQAAGAMRKGVRAVLANGLSAFARRVCSSGGRL